MSKPDWAERLQRTFSRKYEQGYAKGYSHGISFGINSTFDRFREKEKSFQFMQERAFEHGQKMGKIRERERIIKLLDEYKGFFRTVEGGELIDYSEHAIALIKEENK